MVIIQLYLIVYSIFLFLNFFWSAVGLLVFSLIYVIYIYYQAIRKNPYYKILIHGLTFAAVYIVVPFSIYLLGFEGNYSSYDSLPNFWQIAIPLLITVIYIVIQFGFIGIARPYRGRGPHQTSVQKMFRDEDPKVKEHRMKMELEFKEKYKLKLINIFALFYALVFIIIFSVSFSLT